jgi:putative ABC transport system substrate-binding protein
MLACALALVVPWAAVAQQPAKVPRIGVLMPALNPERTRNLAAFQDALHDLGWVESQHLAMEYRFAEHGLEQYPELAADLVRFKVDVLVVGGGAPAVRAAKEATSTIPIVMVSAGALEAGLIDSLAKPGGTPRGPCPCKRI